MVMKQKASNSKDENDSYQPDYDNSFDFSQSLEEAIEEVTGGVPLQVRNLISFRFSMIDEYEWHELPSILCSLKNLRDEKRKEEFDCITESAVCCVLMEPEYGVFYERSIHFLMKMRRLIN